MAEAKEGDNMSLDLNRVAGLLHIIEKAAGHPGKYTGLTAMAQRDLASLEVDAKKEHEELSAKEAKAEEEAKAKVMAKFKADAEAEDKKRMAEQPRARPASDFEPNRKPLDEIERV
jgi:hypothetical protein